MYMCRHAWVHADLDVVRKNFKFEVDPLDPITPIIADNRESLVNADSGTIDFCSLTKDLLDRNNCGTDAKNSYCRVSVRSHSEGENDTSLFDSVSQ